MEWAAIDIISLFFFKAKRKHKNRYNFKKILKFFFFKMNNFYLFILLIVVITLNNIIVEWLNDENNIEQIKHFSRKNGLSELKIVSTSLAVMEWTQCFSSSVITILGFTAQTLAVKIIYLFKTIK